MVHARYGSKDAILDAFFFDDQIKRLSPEPDPTAIGLHEAMGHFDRVQALYREDRDFLRALFVATFEAVKTTSPLRTRVQTLLKRGIDKVETGLRRGVEDGSVRSGIDIARATNDISSAIFGCAYLWTVLGRRYDLDRELGYVRSRLIQDYSASSAR